MSGDEIAVAGLDCQWT